MLYEHFCHGSVYSNLRDTGTSLNRAPILVLIQIEMQLFQCPYLRNLFPVSLKFSALTLEIKYIFLKFKHDL